VQTERTVRWPDGKSFAFTIFDDPDGQTLEGCRTIYDFLTGLGFRTTIGVWPRAPIREANSPGETCDNPAYRGYVQSLQSRGFEVGYHNTTAHSSTRGEIAAGLEAFRDYFGGAPIAMANHYNAEAIYWGRSRLSGARRALYRTATLWRADDEFFGHVPRSAYFWGDLCKEYVRYCRNFVYAEANTLKACPWMPYHDPARAYVDHWYASSEGANIESFVRTLAPENQDSLEAEHGACIMYTHFGHWFVRDGQLDGRFRALIERLSRKNGWFVPVSTLLEHLRAARGDTVITNRERASMEWNWLRRKLVKGTS
jgi:hypothetical protein